MYFFECLGRSGDIGRLWVLGRIMWPNWEFDNYKVGWLLVESKNIRKLAIYQMVYVSPHSLKPFTLEWNLHSLLLRNTHIFSSQTENPTPNATIITIKKKSEINHSLNNLPQTLIPNSCIQNPDIFSRISSRYSNSLPSAPQTHPRHQAPTAFLSARRFLYKLYHYTDSLFAFSSFFQLCHNLFPTPFPLNSRFTKPSFWFSL